VRHHVLIDFIASVILVFTVSSIHILIGTMLSPNIGGYLGIAPLLIGAYLLYQQLAAVENKSDVATTTMHSLSRVWLTTVVLMFSNSADSITVLLPLLAESGPTPHLVDRVNLFINSKIVVRNIS